MAVNLPIRYGGSVCLGNDRKRAHEVLDKSFDTGQWQTAEEAEKMEKESAKYLGVSHGILTSSGTAAGILALSALELPKGSEVIIPATTFPTIFNMILQCGHIPVVIDSKLGMYNLDPEEVEQAICPKTRAIIAVHAVGNPVNMPRLMEIARKHNLKVIEDNCDGWGSTIGDQKVGSFGDVSITSFHAAHIISMGVGGGVFTNDPQLASNVRQYRDWGRLATTNEPHNVPTLPKDYNPRFVYPKIGYNFQILELQAAIGREQLKKVWQIKRARERNFDFLYAALNKYSVEKIILPKFLSNAEISWFAFPLSVRKGVDRGELTQFLEARQIETRPMFAGNILKHPAYSKLVEGVDYRAVGIKEANDILSDSFWISVHPRLSMEDKNYLAKAFDDFFSKKTV